MVTLSSSSENRPAGAATRRLVAMDPTSRRGLPLHDEVVVPPQDDNMAGF
jgi:hypothetical protein